MFIGFLFSTYYHKWVNIGSSHKVVGSFTLAMDIGRIDDQ
ncbi:hypothetical protein LX77_03414 [Gelidibacter algens]|uniref:Uncharacterized protein n=1 Tax=Gelidibacter algens TaxID=49280 RepID=A0A327RVK2_9FLAO|nr:hypothetical protein LX77_03414 [Gelidibacter algens]